MSLVLSSIAMSEKENQYVKLMHENRRMILRVASFYCSDPQYLKDLSQEIAYQIWKSFDTFRAKAEMSTWLYRIALNTSIQFLKREKKRSEEVSYDRYHIDPSNHEQSLTDDEALKQLMDAIQDLKELDKAIILLYLEEKSHSEIAVIVDTSVSNVGTRIQRIKKKLSKMLT
jgi:RNA polymerase sigma-70 factor (ECF subfamily)